MTTDETLLEVISLLAEGGMMEPATRKALRELIPEDYEPTQRVRGHVDAIRSERDAGHEKLQKIIQSCRDIRVRLVGEDEEDDA